MEKQLDFSGRTQLYFQLYDLLYDKITSGEYSPNQLLPTENELMQTYKISRITVRRAMDMLYNDGLIVKKRGYGTIVQERKVEQYMKRVLHFSEEMTRKGYTPSTKMIINEVVQAPKHIASALGIPEGTKLINVYRIRYADEIPLCIESAFLVESLCPDVINHDFSEESLRNLLKTQYGIVWDKAIQQIYAINSNQIISKQLDIAQNSALIYIERVSYTKDGTAGEFLQCYYRGDKYYFTTELQAGN